RGERQGSVIPLIAQCRERGILLKEVDARKMSQACGDHHQGIAAFVAEKPYAGIEDLFALAQERGEPPFIIICDELEDPHNLGAVIRTAEAAGCHGVVIPKHRAVSLTPAVYKASAGAAVHLPVVREVNLSACIKELKKRGVWVYGLDPAGESWKSVDYSGPAALIVGSEGKGIGRTHRELCDRLVSLPMRGQVSSLNASVACGILIYEVLRGRI
ncbi:MAG: 23S rRNA (guanosine(2251)-2'-O)-methyltransferase RlmB, partial [Oscillospiraceae bacterium]|nr:23S rRNA (guanosine(2251)-2'-O)-methyltransferase RlmB [Oscillospiraceae bacterium]